MLTSKGEAMMPDCDIFEGRGVARRNKKRAKSLRSSRAADGRADEIRSGLLSLPGKIVPSLVNIGALSNMYYVK